MYVYYNPLHLLYTLYTVRGGFILYKQMIEKNHKGFCLYLNEDKTQVVDFKVYYADADYRNNQKRIIVSVTQSKLEHKDNGLVIRTFVPLENCNFNIVLENIKRANAKRVDYWS